MATIAVCPLSDLDRVVDTHKASHVLTVVSPDMAVQRPMGIAADNHLILHFNDVGRAAPGMVVAGASDIERMIAFARAWPGDAALVIHCWLGVSRSTASAMVVAATLAPDRSEREIAADLRFQAPFASPNPRIIHLADVALGRNGRLVAAANGIGRGEDCWQGTPFTMDI